MTPFPSVEHAESEPFPVREAPLAPERRGRHRFELRQHLQWKLLRGTRVVGHGTGCTLDISSRGVRFESQEQFPIGSSLELSIDWPVQLNETVPLQIVTAGRVMRVNDRETAIQIHRHQFKLRRQVGTQIPIGPVIQRAKSTSV